MLAPALPFLPAELAFLLPLLLPLLAHPVALFHPAFAIVRHRQPPPWLAVEEVQLASSVSRP